MITVPRNAVHPHMYDHTNKLNALLKLINSKSTHASGNSAQVSWLSNDVERIATAGILHCSYDLTVKPDCGYTGDPPPTLCCFPPIYKPMI